MSTFRLYKNNVNAIRESAILAISFGADWLENSLSLGTVCEIYERNGT